jgi:hypothetical protein
MFRCGQPVADATMTSAWIISRQRTVNASAAAESDRAGLSVCDSETAAEWLRSDYVFIAALNRAKSFQRERLRAEVRSLAFDAMAALRDLVSRPSVAASVRLRASLANLKAADAMNVEQIAPMSEEGVEAGLDHTPNGRTHLLGRLVVFHVGLLVKQQRKPKALHNLDRHGSALDCVQSHLHEIVGERTRSGAWSRHSGVLSVPGLFGSSSPFTKSP